MKKILLVSISIIFFTIANACPFCGCGVGNFYMGLLPEFKSTFVGVRYSYAKYHTNVKADATQFGDDFYNTAELWGGWNINQHWQILAFVPYHINKQVSDDGINKQNGLGDITVMANYSLFKSFKFKNRRSTEQQLWIGAGVKAPTGKFNANLTDPEELLVDANSQMGTGTVDFLVNATYNIRINRFGVNTSANYKINTTNKDNYFFGNRFSASSFAYYRFNKNMTGITPNIGVLYEHAEANKLTNSKVAYSGGYAAFGAAGLDFSIHTISAGISAQLPFAQNFAEGQTKAKLRGIMHVTFTL